MIIAANTGLVHYRRAATDLASCSYRHNGRRSLFVLQAVLMSYIGGGEDGNKGSGRNGSLYAGASSCFLTLHQAHRGKHIESELTRSLKCLHG